MRILKLSSVCALQSVRLLHKLKAAAAVLFGKERAVLTAAKLMPRVTAHTIITSKLVQNHLSGALRIALLGPRSECVRASEALTAHEMRERERDNSDSAALARVSYFQTKHRNTLIKGVPSQALLQ